MLQKTLVREYFRQNIAFYLFIIIFCFGFMSGQEHRQLINIIMDRPALLIFVGLVWSLHVLKSTLFVHQTLQLPEYAFLQENTLLPTRDKWKSLLSLQYSLNMPFVSYSVAMVFLGILKENYLSVSLVILLNLVLVLVPVIWLNRRFLAFNKDYKLVKTIDFQIIPSHRAFYFLRHLLNEKWLLYVSMKLYSIFFIVGAARLFPSDDYDFRLLGLAVFLGTIGLFPLGIERLLFENQKLSFERNLPVSNVQSFITILSESAILLLPEIALIIYYWHDKVGFAHLIGAMCYLVFVMAFWFCIQYSPFAEHKDFHQRMFFVAVFIFIGLMFKVPLLIFSIVILTFSGFILRRNYYNFELSQSEDK